MLTQLFKHAGWVAVGTAIGQGLVLLSTPFLARIYTPAEFGLLALLLTISNIAVAVGCLRYDLALPSAPDADIAGLLRVSLISSAMLAVVAGVIVAIIARVLPTETVISDFARYLPAITLCFFLSGASQATSAMMLRQGSYRSVGILRVSQGGAFAALASLSWIGLLWAYAVSFLGGVTAFLRGFRRSPADVGAWVVARKYSDFPAISLWGAILDVVGFSLCLWTVTAVYGKDAGGELSQVQRLVGAPLMLVSISLGQILLRHTAELLHDKPQMRALLARLLAVLFGLSTLAFVMLFFVGRPLISLVLGEQWSISTQFILASSAAVFVRACISPLSSALITLRRFKLGLLWQGLYFTSAVILFPTVSRLLPLEQFIVFYALHEAVFYGLYLGFIFWALRD